LLTVGHGTLAADEFAELLTGAGIEIVVDVRRFPGSRRHPHFRREVMAEWLDAAGVEYRWEERLGGRRHGAADSPNVGLRNAAFRAYADYMASPDFDAALQDVLEVSAERCAAVMCAESLWWKCHRRLIADAATTLHGREVAHLMHDGKTAPHAVTDPAQVENGTLIYPGDAPTLL
jgi:uncharacterized protein (DUF488 family)